MSIRPLRFLCFMVLLGLVQSLSAAPKLVGDFLVPDSLRWTRDQEADDAYDGLCLVVTARDGVEHLVVLEQSPVVCGTGTAQEAKVAGMLKVFQKACGGKELSMRVAGTKWRGYRSEDPSEGTTLYMGLLVDSGKVYRVHVLRNGPKPLPSDLSGFLNSMKVGGKAKAAYAAQKKAVEAKARTASRETEAREQVAEKPAKKGGLGGLLGALDSLSEGLDKIQDVLDGKPATRKTASPRETLARQEPSQGDYAQPSFVEEDTVQSEGTRRGVSRGESSASAQDAREQASSGREGLGGQTEAGAGGSGKKGAPAWVLALPELPEMPPVVLGEPVDFSSCTKAEFAGAVRSAREACRELVGRLDAAQTREFDAKWEPMLDFPAPQCRDYLEKLTPLLEQALSVKGAIAENLLLNERLWTEAGYAAAYDEQAGAQLMRAVARQAAVLRSLKARAEKLGEEIAALGDPPNPGPLKQEAARRHRRSLQTLAGLLGGQAPLEGAYAYKGVVELTYQSDDPAKGYFEQKPYRADEGYNVFLPVADAGGGRVWFYVYEHREKERPMQKSGSSLNLGLNFDLDFGDEDIPFQLLLMEPRGDTWVNYQWDAETPGDFDVTYYRPTEEALVIEEYSVQGGKYFIAQSSRFERMDKGDVDLYPGSYNERKVRKVFDEHEADLKEAIVAHEKGLKKGEAFLAAKGAHPRIPAFGSLYWVLKDTRCVGEPAKDAVLDTFPGGEVRVEAARGASLAGRAALSWMQRKYELRDVVRQSSGRSAGPGQVMISDPSSEFIGNPDMEDSSSGPATQRVLISEEERRAEVLWSPMPLIVPDGGFIPLRFQGDGEWRLLFSPLRDHSGAPTIALKGMANMDSLYLFKREADDWTTWAPQEDASLMEIDSAKEGTNHLRFVGLRSGDLGLSQREYHLVFAVKSDGGWALQDAVYVLEELEEAEAEELLIQTSRQSEDSKGMLAKYERQAGKRQASSANRKKKVAEMEAEHSLKKEREAFHAANIAFYQREAESLRQSFEQALLKMKQGKASAEDLEAYNMAQFRLACAQSTVINEQDALHELETGEQRFSRTPFDELCRQQMRFHAAQEVRRFDQASRARKKAELLAKKLGGEQGKKAQDMIDRLLHEGASLDPAKMNQLNEALQNIYQGGQLAEIAAIEEEVAWRSCQLAAAENVKAGADTGMVVCSLFGGPAYINAIYQAATGSIEGGPLEGAKRGLSTISDAADIAISGYEGYKSGGFWGMVENASWSILLNKGPEAALNRINMRMARKAADAELPNLKGGEVNAPTAAAVKKTPVDLSPTRAAQFQQELEYGESLAEDFFRSHAKLRTAEIKGGLDPEALDSLRMEVRQKAAAVAHSMPAKSYLKYKAPPAKGRAYTKVMDDILDDATHAYNWEMKNKGYNEQELFSCRNASSLDAGMDADMALREKPHVLPVHGPDGEITYQRNNWLTKDGAPVSLVEYQKEGSKTFQEAYKKVTGGYHAKSSFVDMTTSIGAESYPDLNWLKLPKAGKHDDLAQVTKKMDSFFGKIDPGATPDSLRITAEKADIMFKHHPELRPLGSMMESCRGTAKDLDTKFIPLIEHKIRGIEAKPAAKRTASELRQLSELKEAKAHLSQCMETFKDIGQGRIPPQDWQRRFKQVTGGDDVPGMIRQLTTITINATRER